ncbi:CLUMA_CG008471, isoform A [Clunio marinus]|uniref:CLUMA_CG008471, isoform A n=1 Tax=Clunio marinus TaxID=568069 RepID=A0A1J1I3R6_9DIPT|nr:CLUMA_CG008471, isoform A [Clunio marinus]
MYFTENSSLHENNMTKHFMDDELIPEPLNSKFDVSNSEVVLIMLTVIYVIIFVTGVLGNVVTCIVIARNKAMHTAVNYYLFSLAVSDLLLLVSALPDEVYMLWFREYPFDETICKFHKFAAESFTNATVLTITAFTIERYVAICKPFLSHTMSKLSRAYKFILVIWLISICLAVPQTLFTLHLDENFLICVPKQDYNHLFVVSTIFLFVIPMSIITILYVLIGLQLRKSKIVQRGAVNGSSVRLKRKIFKKATNQTLVTVKCESLYNEALLQNSSDGSKNNFIDHESIIPEDGRINYSHRGPAHLHGSRHVVNMLVVVVIAFFLCWCPFHVQRIVFTYIEHGAIDQNLSFSINTISGVLFFVSTCINPFLYNIMSNKFREAFKVTIASYFSRSSDNDSIKTGKLFRTISQRSYSCSLNSTSLNTCSSVCSMQPFNQSQQLPFRYFDSARARKRPLVVSFKRIHKMTPTNPDSCNSVSICDIHRTDIQLKEHNDNNVMTTRIKSKYGANPSRLTMHRQTCNSEGQTTSNFPRTSRFDSLYSEKVLDRNNSDKGCIFPKEKFYGNAKLLLTINDDILRKTVIDCEDCFDHDGNMKTNRLKNLLPTHHLLMDKVENNKNKYFRKIEIERRKRNESISSIATDDSEMIDDCIQICKANALRNNFLSRQEETRSRLKPTAFLKSTEQNGNEISENETDLKAFGKLNKSLSTPSIYPYESFKEQEDNYKAFKEIQKSVSMVRIKKI